MLLMIDVVIQPDDRGPGVLVLPMYSDRECATSKW